MADGLRSDGDLIEDGDEFSAEKGEQRQAADQANAGSGEEDLGMRKRPVQHRAIASLGPSHHKGVAVSFSPQEQQAERRRQRKRQQQGHT